MSTVTPPVNPDAPQAFKPGLIARGIALFSGSVGLAIKIGLLSLSNALAAWAVYVLISHHRWPALAIVIASTALIDWLYLVPRTWALPAKFLLPGTVFLIGFQIIPIIFTISIALSNYSTGHILTEGQAIESIKVNSLQPPPNGRQYDVAAAHDGSGKLVLLMHDETT